MPLHYDETHLQKAEELLKAQGVIQAHVKPLMTKISNGVKYITSKESVEKSGLSKAEVKEIIDAFDKNAPIVKQLEDHRKQFELSVRTSYLQQKKDLENQLAGLKHESDAALRRFPRGNSQIIGDGPYGWLKDAYKEMH